MKKKENKNLLLTDSRNKYLKLSIDSAKHNEANDCTVRALSLTCDISYDKAHEIFKNLGRKNRHGVLRYITFQAIKRAGKNFEEIKIEEFILSKYPKSQHFRKTVTPKHPFLFKKVWQDGNSYMMFVKGHVLAIVNGEVLDWSENRAFRANCLIKIV